MDLVVTVSVPENSGRRRREGRKITDQMVGSRTLHLEHVIFKLKQGSLMHVRGLTLLRQDPLFLHSLRRASGE